MKEFEPEILAWVSSNEIEVFPIPPDMEEEQELEILLSFLLTNSIKSVIIDHHTLGYKYSLRLRENDFIVVQIDDEGTRNFCCDLLINYNIYATSLNYKTEPHTKCLFGPQYAIIRKQFHAGTDNKNSNTNLLVIMGGGYARGEVIKVLKALEYIGNDVLRKIKPNVIFGSGYPDHESVFLEYEHLPVKFHYNPENIGEIMEESAFAVSGAGGSLYELSRMRVPSITIVLDNNQKLNAHFFDESGISKNLGWYEDVNVESIAETIINWINSPEELNTRRAKAAVLVDGKGVERIVNSVVDLIPSN